MIVVYFQDTPEGQMSAEKAAGMPGYLKTENESESVENQEEVPAEMGMDALAGGGMGGGEMGGMPGGMQGGMPPIAKYGAKLKLKTPKFN